jgi:hypothetical protein
MRLGLITTLTSRRSTQTWNPRRGRQRPSKNSTGDLVVALRSRGVVVITALDADLVGRPDDEQLAFASDHGCVLYTFNVPDFFQLHTEYLGAGKEHAGMIPSPQQRSSVGEQLRRILSSVDYDPPRACGTKSSS